MTATGTPSRCIKVAAVCRPPWSLICRTPAAFTALAQYVMFAKEHELPVYVAAEAHSTRQDVADLITVVDAAKELGYTVQHVRRLARTGLLQRERISGLLIRSDVLTLKRQRKRGS